MHGLLLWIIIYLVVSYVFLPLVILSKQKMAAHPQFLLPDLAALAPEVSEFLFSAARELASDGFDEPTFVAMPNQMSNVAAYLIMLLNRSTGDKAMITAMFSTAQGGSKLTTQYVEFSTRYENGQVFDTLNSKTLGSFRRSPKTFKTQVPQVQDVHILYRLHQYMMNQSALGGPKSLYARGEAVPYLTRVMIESYDQQVKYGILTLNAKSESYRPTLKGAYLMTWGMIWPVNTIRTFLMERHAADVLRAFDTASRIGSPVNG